MVAIVNACFSQNKTRFSLNHWFAHASSFVFQSCLRINVIIFNSMHVTHVSTKYASIAILQCTLWSSTWYTCILPSSMWLHCGIVFGIVLVLPELNHMELSSLRTVDFAQTKHTGTCYVVVTLLLMLKSWQKKVAAVTTCCFLFKTFCTLSLTSLHSQISDTV